jgi:dGTPase
MLARHASDPAQSRGRRHPEAAAPTRTAFQRDRDRIVHSTAFRRLVYKTQVFLNHEGDLFRTRLTHSLEVAQLGRSIARSLQLNEDLVEAIALAHDLGHTPFGHAGQDALNECMARQGGFEHNLQSLRVVDTLEERYPDFDGLNLTLKRVRASSSTARERMPKSWRPLSPAVWDGGFSTGPSPAWKPSCATWPTRSPTTHTTLTTACAPG